ncbi:hypothetical protein ABGB19_22275 [Mycobacterium sp. B14F4]|uniref:hypothetical protein n=1 Tax=Mycobacterium sp. B14F4 TaxID=3153565 RepID=UPI00325EC095
MGASVVALALSPVATAQQEAYQYVRTESGQVRCVISAEEAVCERASADGFPGAPAGADGTPSNLAIVHAEGDFNWNVGNIGDGGSSEVVLTYRTPFSFHGWTVVSTFDGTRLTNDGTGHGMFVSVDGVSSY